MSRQSIGSETPEDKIDADRDGAPDRAEQDFASDGRAQPTGSDALTSRPHQSGRAEAPAAASDEVGSDDEGLESTREHRGTVVPPASN